MPLLVALLMNHPSTNWKSWKDAHSDILDKLSHYKIDNKQAKLMVNGIAFTGGSTAKVDIQKTLDAVHAIWPATAAAITKESFVSLGRDLMAVFGLDINNTSHHKVIGKILEMVHWHNMPYEGQRPVGFYWVHLEGIVELPSISPEIQKEIADTGLKWIRSGGWISSHKK